MLGKLSKFWTKQNISNCSKYTKSKQSDQLGNCILHIERKLEDYDARHSSWYLWHIWKPIKSQVLLHQNQILGWQIISSKIFGSFQDLGSCQDLLAEYQIFWRKHLKYLAKIHFELNRYLGNIWEAIKLCCQSLKYFEWTHSKYI